MNLVFDTFYFDDKAHTVCLAFAEWEDENPCHEFSEIRYGIEDYMNFTEENYPASSVF